MAKVEEAVRDMAKHNPTGATGSAMAELPGQVRDIRRELRDIRSAIEQFRSELRQLAAGRRPVAVRASVAATVDAEAFPFSPAGLKQLRQRFCLTQQELATLLQVKDLAVSAWECGRNRPRPWNMARIAALVSMSQEQVNAALGRRSGSRMSPQQIRDLRTKLSLSQVELAERLGVSSAAVAMWERGRSAPQARNRAALGRIAEVGEKELDRPMKQKSIPRVVGKPAEQPELSPEEIVGIRKKAGLSQRALAKKLSVSVNSISNWETGSTSPRAASIKKLLAMRK